MNTHTTPTQMKTIKTLLLTPMIALLLASCGGKESTTKSNTNTPSNSAQSGKVIKVGIEPLYPPFVQSTPQGDFQGFDVDLLRAAGEKAGFSVQIAAYPWSGLFDRLNNNEVDVVAGGVSVTDSRKNQYDFTTPYYENTVVLAVPQNSNIHNFDQIAGKLIAYQKDTSSANELRKLQGKDLDIKLGEDSAWQSIKRLSEKGTNKSDGVIGDSGSLNYYANQYKDLNLRIIPHPTLPKESIAFAVKKGNTEILNLLNKGLEQAKTDGTYAQLQSKWLGNTPPK